MKKVLIIAMIFLIMGTSLIGAQHPNLVITKEEAQEIKSLLGRKIN